MGERASAAVYGGAGLCLVAIVLVSMEAAGAPGPGRRGHGQARSAGGPRPGLRRRLGRLAFGIFFLFIRNAGTSGVLWPVCCWRGWPAP